MGYRYLVLVGTDEQTASNMVITASLHLGQMGMSLRLACGLIAVFASEETPTISLPHGGIVIGHLFNSNGKPVGNDAGLREPLPDESMRRHVLRHLWGEYLLVEPFLARNQGLRITRDPSGGVGCVYGMQGGTTFITSDISIATMLELYSKRINWEFVAYFLTYSNHKTRRTALSGVHELLPGCSLLLHDASTTTEPEWSPWDFVANESRFHDSNEAASTVHEAVLTSVAAWSSIDRCILLELSGGLDSSIIAACLHDSQAHVACCTIATPVPGADEQKYARMVADRFEFPLRCEELAFDSARIDFPPPSHSVTPCMTALQYATDSLMKRVGDASIVDSYFSGGGGDTIFCYSSTSAPAADAIRELGIAKGIEAIRDLAELHHCTFWKAARLTLKKILSAPKAPISADGTFLAPSTAARAPDAHPWIETPSGAFHGDRERIASLAGTQVFRDGLPRGMYGWLRMPLLSQPVMEACLRVPSWMWITGGLNRAVARSAFSAMLPHQIVQRRSKGTFFSYSGTVLRRNKAYVRDFLLSGRLRAHGLLDTAALEAALDDHTPPQEDSLQRIFDLCMVENWVRHQP